MRLILKYVLNCVHIMTGTEVLIRLHKKAELPEMKANSTKYRKVCAYKISFDLEKSRPYLQQFRWYIDCCDQARRQLDRWVGRPTGKIHNFQNSITSILKHVKLLNGVMVLIVLYQQIGGKYLKEMFYKLVFSDVGRNLFLINPFKYYDIYG